MSSEMDEDMRNIIQFENIIKTQKRGGQTYLNCDFLVKINDKYFSPDLVSDHSIAVQKFLSMKYWKVLREYYRDDWSLIVRLSGAHFKLDDMKDYLFSKNAKRNLILHYHWWPADQDATYDENCFAVIECDKVLFKKLFDRFWFAVGYEIRFEGIVIPKKKTPDIERWSRKMEGTRKEISLIKLSTIVFDNCSNGFHFRVVTREENAKYAKTAVETIIGRAERDTKKS